jgi:hypothetical protein
MIFVDTDIFVVDKLFQGDERFGVNREFLNLREKKSTSIYNVLELCGLASFSLSAPDLMTLFTNFHKLYDLTVLYPKIVHPSPEEMLRYTISKIFEKICLKMNYPDAQILLIAEGYDCSYIVTWNKRHFEGRTYIPIRTPEEYLKEGKNS